MCVGGQITSLLNDRREQCHRSLVNENDQRTRSAAAAAPPRGRQSIGAQEFLVIVIAIAADGGRCQKKRQAETRSRARLSSRQLLIRIIHFELLFTFAGSGHIGIQSREAPPSAADRWRIAEPLPASKSPSFSPFSLPLCPFFVLSKSCAQRARRAESILFGFCSLTMEDMARRAATRGRREEAH